MRVAPYMRVSTEEQALEGYSLPEQLRDLRPDADEKGWQVVAEETYDTATT